jgi:hypothetical protein
MRNVYRILERGLKVNDYSGDQNTDVKSTLKHARFEIPREGNMKISFFWDLTQCSLV